MGGGERVLVKVIVGHKSSLLQNPNPDGHLFKWTVFVKAAENLTDRSFINKVTFRLHETFPNPMKTVREPPFEVSETGHSSFVVHLAIHFNYSGGKPIKYDYDMVIVLDQNGYNQQEVMFELKDVPTSFIDIIKRHGALAGKKKRDSTGKDALPYKKMRVEDFAKSSGEQEPSRDSKDKKDKKSDKNKLKPRPRDYKDRDNREKDRDREAKDREPSDKDRSDQRDRDRDKEKKDFKEREAKEKEPKEKEHKEKEPKERKDKLLKEFEFYKLQDKKPLNARSPKTVVKDDKKSENSKEQQKPEKEEKKLSPNGVSLLVKNQSSLSKPQMSNSPRIEARVRLSDSSESSSPSSSMSSSSNDTANSLYSSPNRILSAEEMQKKILSLTSEDQIFKVASILLSQQGTTLLPSKSSISFDLDLASVDPSLIQRLSQVLST